MTSLRIVSVNIERSRHLDLVVPFLKRVRPEVLCIQELMEHDVPTFERELGMRSAFVPMTRRAATEPGILGIGIFTALPVDGINTYFYRGEGEATPEYVHGHRAASMRHALLVCEIEKDGALFKVGTTHFPVTPNGLPDDVQRHDMPLLLDILRKQGEIFFTGDFNAPRGGEMFALLASAFKDNVPAEYATSIDGGLHRAGQLPHMVDGLFSTPGYAVSGVEMIGGVSDHKALLCNVSKA